MHKVWILVSSLFLIAACNNENNSTEQITATEADTLQQTETAAEITYLEKSFPDLFAYMEGQDAAFEAQNFELGSEVKMDPLPAVTLEPGQLKPFEPFLIYNSDSTKAIDLYSYNYIITRRNGEVKLEEAGPDTEVALIDVASNTRQRIFFSGPSVMVFEARWNNNNEIVMAGAEQVDNQKIKPLAWQYNLTDSVMQTYTYDEAIAANMKNFKDQKIMKNSNELR
jgi:hypothetical protein